MKIHVLHENEAWTAPLFEELRARDLPFENWHLDAGLVDPRATPPEGVFYNRMSASSHTRDHRFAPELTRHTLAWLEAHGRRTVNGSGAIRLEIDKLAQYAALEAHGIRTPRTLGAVGRAAVLRAARALGEFPFILKPNRGGAGAGVQLIESLDQLAAVLDDPATPEPLDGTWLVQQYVRASEPAIIRCEFIGGEFYYAVRVNTSLGFELCPADACDLPDGPRAVRDHRGLQRPDPEPLPRHDRRQRHRGHRHRVHPRRAGPDLHLRRQHQHQLQPPRRGRGWRLRHGPPGRFPRPRA